MISNANGQIWMVQLANAEVEAMRQRYQVLHAQRQGEMVSLRIAHATKPHVDAQLVLPNLEDALMAQRYSLQEVVQ
jgi:ABC-2 type transport system ATP-binding protein